LPWNAVAAGWALPRLIIEPCTCGVLVNRPNRLVRRYTCSGRCTSTKPSQECVAVMMCTLYRVYQELIKLVQAITLI